MGRNDLGLIGLIILFIVTASVSGIALGNAFIKYKEDTAPKRQFVIIEALPIEKWFPPIQNDQELKFAIKIMDNFIDNKASNTAEAYFIVNRIERYQEENHRATQ